MQSVGLLWAQHKHSGAFTSIVAQEFERALSNLSADVMQNEVEVCQPVSSIPCAHWLMTTFIHLCTMLTTVLTKIDCLLLDCESV